MVLTTSYNLQFVPVAVTLSFLFFCLQKKMFPCYSDVNFVLPVELHNNLAQSRRDGNVFLSLDF